MILQADKLTLQYGQKIIADKLNFKVDKSEIISIIGPNGSGKSTLLKSLGRLLKPTHGTVCSAAGYATEYRHDVRWHQQNGLQ